MKLLVLGAGGGVGTHLVSYALQRGHSVTVLLRPERQVELPPEVKVVRGTFSDATSLLTALEGVDAVFSSVGMQRKQPWNPFSSASSPRNLCSHMASRLVAGMTEMGVKRVVAVSAAGVGDSAEGLNPMMRAALSSTMIGDAYRDLGHMEEVFTASKLDWLCPRPTRLTNGPGNGRIVVVDEFATGASISRANVAIWMLDTLLVSWWPSPIWVTRTPQISE